MSWAKIGRGSNKNQGTRDKRQEKAIKETKNKKLFYFLHRLLDGDTFI